MSLITMTRPHGFAVGDQIRMSTDTNRVGRYAWQ